MHGIPKNTDLTPIIGKIVEQVCIGTHEVILNLEDDLYITIEGGFSFGDEVPSENPNFPHSANAFAELLGSEITYAKVLSTNKVAFIFSSTKVLTIYDDSDTGESFLIKLPDRLIVA